MHPAVDEPEAKTPALETVDQVAQGVLELGEEEQTLLGAVEEAFGLKQVLVAGELGLAAVLLDAAGLPGQGARPG